MVVMFNILLWFFGIIAGVYLLDFLFGSKFGWHKMITMIVSIFIVAISAGYVYGGLFQ